MSKKKRKNDDRGASVAAAPSPASKPAKSRPERIPAVAQGIAGAPANRGKFAVARAKTALAEALPDLIFTKTRPGREPLAPAKPRVSTPPLTVSATSPNSSPRKPAAPSMDARKPLTMDKPQPTCKARPKTSKGDGSSRAFIPWCNK